MSVSTHLKIDLHEYDARIRTFIPHYQEMLDAAVAALIACADPIATVVDLGIGTGALAERVTGTLRRVRVVGIDTDPGMLAMAGRRLPPRRTTFVHEDFVEAKLPRSDAVMASLSLHHIERQEVRKALFRRIKRALRPGGVLVSADCHPSSHPALAAAGRSAWRDHLAATYGRRKAEAFLRAWSHEDFYVPLEKELKHLRACGLATDLAWRRGAFAVIVATA